jgi:hypothetical protein
MHLQVRLCQCFFRVIPQPGIFQIGNWPMAYWYLSISAASSRRQSGDQIKST